MSKNTLDNLFGSKVRVKLLKFLFRNYPGEFSVYELSRRIQEPLAETKKELEIFEEMGLVIKKISNL